jgi:dTMP kinase
MAKKGLFIVIEGLDGSGKTTQAKLLVEKLQQKYSVIFTTEPSNGKIGSFIRNSYLYDSTRLPTEAEALLFSADRIEHCKTEIEPALNQRKIVVCDRYLYSTIAYQGGAGLSTDWIKTINARALQPDFCIFLDMAPERVLERLQRKRSVMETLETQQKVREVYLRFVEKGDLVLVDGDKPVEVVAEALYAKVLELLEIAQKFGSEF